MRELTDYETHCVNGQWGLPGAGVGAAAGAAGYLGTVAAGGGFDAWDFGYAVAGGAVGGAISGPVGAVRAYLAPRVAFGMGAGWTAMERNARR